MTTFRTEKLNNGVDIAFTDLSNRYYGDYHRVCVEVRITAPCPPGYSGSVAAPQPGNCLIMVKRLERMGVAGNEVAAARERLVDDFWRHAGRYLAHPDFPTRLAASNARVARKVSASVRWP
jgi:hypothetical protein